MITLQSIQNKLGLSDQEWLLLVKTAPYRYKTYSIPKRSGGRRQIAHPSKVLKIVQKLILEFVLCELPIHTDVVMAYEKNTSTLKHAKKHASNRFLLKLDFKDFFPSLRGDDFHRLCLDYLPQLTEIEINQLKRLLFWIPDRSENKLVLSIGAPSSPKVSNALLYNFDTQLNDYCLGMGVVYSRYADDMAFSTNCPNLLSDVANQVKSICQEIRYPILKINESKTVQVFLKNKRFLTGLVLANDGTVGIGRDKKRALRAELHRFAQSPSSFSEEQRFKLKGMLNYVQSVDPEFMNTMIKIMSKTNQDVFLFLKKHK